MSFLIDFLSIVSVVGIWPRFVEPKMISVKEVVWKLPKEHSNLDNLVIVQISDLHFNKKISQKFLDKVLRSISRYRPSLILFTGDFLCYSKLEDSERLKKFLSNLAAPLGCFCVLGNHDYERYVSRNYRGIYDAIKPTTPFSGLWRSIRRCFNKNKKIFPQISNRVLSIKMHNDLCNLLNGTQFKLLENQTITLPIGLNITGLGDVALGRCLPKLAFANYDSSKPGIVMSHNPDSFPLICDYPGDWILSGHTHGEQIYLPLPKFLKGNYTRGFYKIGSKKIYINRGLGGCHKPFRLFAPPEITILRAVS